MWVGVLKEDFEENLEASNEPEDFEGRKKLFKVDLELRHVSLKEHFCSLSAQRLICLRDEILRKSFEDETGVTSFLCKSPTHSMLRLEKVLPRNPLVTRRN